MVDSEEIDLLKSKYLNRLKIQSIFFCFFNSSLLKKVNFEKIK